MTNKHSGVFILTRSPRYPFLQLTEPHFIASPLDNADASSAAGVSRRGTHRQTQTPPEELYAQPDLSDAAG